MIVFATELAWAITGIPVADTTRIGHIAYLSPTPTVVGGEVKDVEEEEEVGGVRLLFV